ncbi:Glycosyltransferase involved in cell wall bisynthesis [Candidatus Electrothrix aarhusensis]|uniref:Glycosyltransferase involved in cell wall bisynthesis n=1 Tax=Candidatus Electrothrix aarhusensis TaxID=1859131 RepID=A0A3S3RND0_9BACT|nr:Glycosyltransferase involved in cell wall bisynthesis [Candidatus Electrothrix aarhusensis]
MKIIFFANTDWYLYNFRLALARSLREQGAEVIMMSPPGEYGSRIEAEGFRWIPLPMERRSLNPFREIQLLRYICSIYKKEQPDAVHNFTIKSVIYGALAAQAAGVKNRIHAVTGLGHVFISQSMRARILRPLVKGLLRQALRGKGSHLILQNPDDRSLFLKHKLTEAKRIHLIRGSGVDIEHFAPVQRERKGKFRVLLAARLLWEKGIREYAEAAELLTHRSDELEFLLAGVADPGNPSAVPKQDMMRWQKSGLLTVLGHVENMQQLMTEVDLMVLPSWREGTPRGLLEAASMALPIITTDAPGCREIVENERNGFLVPVGDTVALAEKIEYLLDHPETCLRFGTAGRKKVCKEFDQEIVFRQTWEVYRSLGILNKSIRGG